MTNYKRIIFSFVVTFCCLTGFAQTRETINELEQRYQTCLDKGDYMLGCSQTFYNQMDSLLNVRYKKLRSLCDDKQKKLLKNEQLEWLSKRDKQFIINKKQVSKEGYGGGRDEEMSLIDRNTDYVKQRVIELIDSSPDKYKVNSINADAQENDSLNILNNRSNKYILNLLIGDYVKDEGCNCEFKLSFKAKNEKLNFHIKTNKRNISGVAEIVIDENEYVYIIFPIEWDDYQGDMTLDTYEPNKEEKPKKVDMLFDPERKTIRTQNYGNAMNNYTIFDECRDDKEIALIKKSKDD